MDVMARSTVLVDLPGSISLQEGPGGALLRLRGEIDAAVVGRFEQVHGTVPLPVDAIDAGAVTFIGAIGVVFLIRWSKASAAGGRSAVLRRSSRFLDGVLSLSGLDGVLAAPTTAEDRGTPRRRRNGRGPGQPTDRGLPGG